MRRAVGEKQKQCSSWLVVQSGSLWQPGAHYSYATTGEEMKKKYNPELLAPKFQLTRPSRQLTNSPIPPETLCSCPWTHSLSVPYPPLWLLLTRAHYGLLFSFELDIHPPYISAWAGPSLFTLCLASGLSDTFSKSKLINLIVTGEWQELCGTISAYPPDPRSSFSFQICVLNFWQADLSHWTFHRHLPTSCPLSPSLSW